MSAVDSTEQDEVIWCRACGIPHAVGTAYCSLCDEPLAAAMADTADDTAPVPTDATAETDTGALARALAERVARGRSPRERRGPRWPVSRRPVPLSDEEIEARAAAIVAQARAAEAAGEDADLPDGSSRSALLAEAEALGQLDFLPALRERDRQWLIAGFFCCLFLILFAIGFVRFFAA